jgi:branched-chain amino acid transport system ATP-binding protein
LLNVAAILEVKGVTKRFGGLVAVDDVNFEIRAGEIMGLIGPNGAGKTTLLNVIAGVYRPNSGAVRWNGEPIHGLPPEKICRKGIARTFQICMPFPKMTALENVTVAATFGNSPPVHKPRELAEEILEFVGFPLDFDTVAVNLNTGQLRRLDLARALASKPKLLLMDEAAAGLTPGELADLQVLIMKIRDQGTTILIVEHLMRLILAICDRILVLHYGHPIALGSPREIMSDPAVTEAYFGEIPVNTH